MAIPQQEKPKQTPRLETQQDAGALEQATPKSTATLEQTLRAPQSTQAATATAVPMTQTPDQLRAQASNQQTLQAPNSYYMTAEDEARARANQQAQATTEANAAGKQAAQKSQVSAGLRAGLTSAGKAVGDTTSDIQDAETARQRSAWLDEYLNKVDKEIEATGEPMSKEDIEKQRKRRRAQAVVAGISDALSSLANLYFTAQYAPSMPDKDVPTLSKKMQERWEKAQAEADKNNAKRTNLMELKRKAILERQAQEQAAKDAANKQHNEEIKLQIQQLKANAEAEKQKAMADLAIGKLNKAEAETKLLEIQEQYARDYGYLMGRYNYSTNVSYRNGGGGSGKSGGSGSDKRKYVVTAYGEDKTHENATDYAKTVEKEVSEYNATHPDDQINPQKVVGRNIRDKKASEKAAELDLKTQGQKRPTKSKKNAGLKK